VVRGRFLVNLNDVVLTDFGVFFLKKSTVTKRISENSTSKILFIKIAHLKRNPRNKNQIKK
jgi:hypothetical protein